MFDDITGKEKDYEEKVLIKKSDLKAMRYNIDTKQKMIESMVTEIVALRLKIKDLESVLDGLNIDSVVP